MKEKPVIFILSHDRLTYLKKLINRLLSLNQDRIVIIDTDSKYESLLEFYNEVKNTFEIIYMCGNYRGRIALMKVYNNYKDKYHLEVDNYIYTDCDTVPSEECPEDFIEVFNKLLERYSFDKVGFGLRIDNLPDHFAGKSFIINQQKYRWEPPFIEDFGVKVKVGGIDSTFSYRRAGTVPGFTGNACRTRFPYVADHLPWYVDSSNLTEEDKYYFKTASSNFSTYLRDMKNGWQLPSKWRKN